MEEKKLNIYQKLLEVQKRVVGLGKNQKSFNYDYVTGAKVLDNIKPIMNEVGLILKQEIINLTHERIDYKSKNSEKSEILYTAELLFTWVDVETGEKDENRFAASGMNDWEKGVGSILTYAERYFLLKYFHIKTDEDDIDNPNRKPEDDTPEPKQSKKKEKPIEKNVEELDRQVMLKEIPIKLQNKQAGYYENVLKFFKLPEDTPIEKLSDKHLKTLYDNLNK
jgi:hypothetical protein